jgi:hypothetical protein
MTTDTLSLSISRFAYKVSYVFEAISFHAKAILSSIIEAQTRKAEFEVAKMLHAEYKGESFDYILHMVQEGRVDEIAK